MIEWFDYGILDWFQSIHTPVLSYVLNWITMSGEAGIIWIAMGLLLLFPKETRKTGIVVLLALLFCLLTGNVLLKNIVARPRPCWRHPEVEMLVSIPKDYSFPSGHAMSSFAAAVSVFLYHKRWGIAALALATVMSMSRLYFYVHYPTDVLAGLVIGVLLAFLARGIVEKQWERRRRKQRKVKQ